MSWPELVGTVASLAVFSIVGCMSPEDVRRYEISDTDDGDELHLPGRPCLVCHREGYSPGDDEFQVAGTIFLTPTSELGLRNVRVEVTDATGFTASVDTNEAGNFMIEKGDEDEDERERAGKIKVRRLAYPLEVRLIYDGMEKLMETVIWREGSCAHCHTLDGPDGASEGRVYFMDAAP